MFCSPSSLTHVQVNQPVENKRSYRKIPEKLVLPEKIRHLENSPSTCRVSSTFLRVVISPYKTFLTEYFLPKEMLVTG